MRGTDAGGSHFIGRSVWWERSEAIVLAFVRDSDIGDLWKIKWTDEADTCDMEHSELMKGLKAWDRKCVKKKDGGTKKRGGVHAVTAYSDGSYPYKKNKSRNGDPDFMVDGIEGGILLAASFHPQARSDVMWPARVMHDEEGKIANNGKKMKGYSVNVVFFSPYWTANNAGSGGRGKQGYIMTPNIFEMEVVDANKKMIQPYPFEASAEELDIEELRMSFSLTGLPKDNFNSYVDAHRLALGFKKYGSANNGGDGAFVNTDVAALRDCHLLSLKTPCFSAGLLELPWSYILEKLNAPASSAIESAAKNTSKEPVLDLQRLLNTLEAPLLGSSASSDGAASMKSSVVNNGTASPAATKQKLAPPKHGTVKQGQRITFAHMFFSGKLLEVLENDSSSNLPEDISINWLSNAVDELLLLCGNMIGKQYGKGVKTTVSEAMDQMSRLLNSILLLKGRGEDFIKSSAELTSGDLESTIFDWRRGMEDLFGYVRRCYSIPVVGIGIGATNVLTDSRCSAHLTSSGSMERSVRLPAALKGAKNAGAGTKSTFKILSAVEDAWVDLALQKILPMCHEKRYIQRLVQKIKDIGDGNERGVPLTDDSDGKGGEDTGGSKGSYDAALSGVACALKGTSMVCTGER